LVAGDGRFIYGQRNLSTCAPFWVLRYFGAFASLTAITLRTKKSFIFGSRRFTFYQSGYKYWEPRFCPLAVGFTEAKFLN